MNNIKNITDNIYVTTTKNLDFTYLTELKILNIKYIININNYSNILKNNDDIKILNFNIDRLKIYISGNPIDIDFDLIDNILISAIKNNYSVLICDENYLLSFLLIGRFLAKYYKLTFTETVYWLANKLNIDINSKIYKNIIYQLFSQFSLLNL